ncbi:hypothetical protein CYLTODRAFT_422575 [Cylindrobasidium torrendii FP15055 ss-10]|uniref:Uncharacterized protein n=1 Tax=Cylindrobasidium torrendii FP15055 ss-10 TaxID=1314674 RepID=A0A0D7BA23_9AGAR|nr:hypothetical protein CYLTODRAFT_422575 [Cylindrobasidium torrendii FP15055 ss-10]
MYYTWLARRNTILLWCSVQAGFATFVMTHNPNLHPKFMPNWSQFSYLQQQALAAQRNLAGAH